MENGNQNLQTPPAPAPMPPVAKKWYQHKGILAIIILAVITAVISYVAFNHQSIIDRYGLAGGGGSEQYAPDNVSTGQPAIIQLIVSTWGSGGPIKGRYTGISLSYKLASETDYKTLQPEAIPLPDNYQKVETAIKQWEAYQFTIPPYPQGKSGQIQYYIDLKLDGQANRINGAKQIQVSDASSTTNSNYDKSSLSWTYIYGPENGKVKVYLYAPDQTSSINQNDYGFASAGDTIIDGHYKLVVDPTTATDGLEGEWSHAQIDLGELQFNPKRPLADGKLQSLQLDQNGYQDAVTFYQYGSSNTDVVYVYNYLSNKLSLVHFVFKNAKTEDFTETGLGGGLTANSDRTFTSQWYDNTRGYVTTKWQYNSKDNNLHESETQVSTNPSQASSDMEFTGTIQAVKNEQPYDGPLSIEVNDKWIIIGGGEMAPNASNGSVIGFDSNTPFENNVGKKVEVYAAKIAPENQNNLTILGDSKYYVKLVQ
jgi:hypothetical protein